MSIWHRAVRRQDMRTQKAPRSAWIGLAVLTLPCVITVMDLTVLNLAVPHLSAALKPTGAQLLWIIDIYGFMLATGFAAIWLSHSTRNKSPSPAAGNTTVRATIGDEQRTAVVLPADRHRRRPHPAYAKSDDSNRLLLSDRFSPIELRPGQNERE